MMYTQSGKRKWTTHSEDPNSGASSSSTLPRGGDFEGGGEQREGNSYEVFLSFRGKDTRKGFTDHLYTRLVDAGIHVFRDDNELRVGEEIGPELFRSITQSKISILIISEDYASSKWCLRELALILKCKRERGQTVLPIFYKVEPWHVRHLAGTFGDAINAHKKNLDERTVQEWVKALEEVTSLKGWESDKIDDGQEATLVKEVVTKVTSKLKRQFLQNVPDQLVGIDDHVGCIMSFIDAKCSDCGMIGIYGMGGIGKTTLAKLLYNKLSSRYEYRSFVEDIRETDKREGIACVQKQLISNINGNSWNVSDVNDGINILKSRFTHKKVLIILDDVDKTTRLDALVGDDNYRNWFKAGSIVILTTRDKGILERPWVSYKYPLNELPLNQSLVLFSRHALRMDSPPTDYEVISGDIVSTTGGLPLALVVIGSFLCGKTKEAWKATSEKLKKVPNADVQKKLKISYDDLTPENQRIFLDIACFFIGSSKQYPTYMWDACGCYPGMGIEELSLLSLIKIGVDGKLLMHDQLRDMGRDIVRLENEKPGKRSRLWNNDDAVEVLGNNKGTSKIEVLRLDNWERIKVFRRDNWEYGWPKDTEEVTNYTAEQLKGLTSLRFLHVSGANFTGDFQDLLPKLRGLRWDFYSLDFEATHFHPKKLAVLDLSRSRVSADWGGWDPLKMATELKVLELSCCEYLRRTPDLSAFKSLEILNLRDCQYLEEIHPSIREIKTLVSLNVKGCLRLKELPAWVDRMEESREPVFTRARVQEIPISRVLSQHPRTTPTNNLAMDHQTADSEHALKRSKPFGISDEVNNLPVYNLHVTFNSQSHGQSSNSSDNLPKNVVMTLNEDSPVKSMDFHPVQQILLLVGTDMGDVIVREVGSRARIAVRNFKVWDLGTCSKALQASLADDNKASVNRVMWSPDGFLFVVAYSKHIVHIYSYLGGDDIRNHLEIEAHDGSVNDLAFSYPKKQLCVVTCGEDKSIKVWDAVTGAKQHSFKGHEAPVYSICPHQIENILFIYSTSTDGKIKAWLYDKPRVKS